VVGCVWGREQAKYLAPSLFGSANPAGSGNKARPLIADPFKSQFPQLTWQLISSVSLVMIGICTICGVDTLRSCPRVNCRNAANGYPSVASTFDRSSHGRPPCRHTWNCPEVTNKLSEPALIHISFKYCRKMPLLWSSRGRGIRSVSGNGKFLTLSFAIVGVDVGDSTRAEKKRRR
jgi:hypothetical protein